MARDSALGLSGLALLALQAHCAYAQNVNCRFYGDADGRIEGDVEIAIPCTLTNVEIDGDVIVFSGGSLVANDVWIKGDLYTSRADFIDMERSQIDGNVRLEELVGDETIIEGTNIDGDILARAQSLTARDREQRHPRRHVRHRQHRRVADLGQLLRGKSRLHGQHAGPRRNRQPPR